MGKEAVTTRVMLGERESDVDLSEVLKKLRTLQEVLFRKFQIETEINEIPRALSAKTELLNRLKKSYVDKNDLYNQIRERINELRDRAIQAEADREKYEGQMDAIKTQREYEALDKEIRDSGDREIELRHELQREEEHLTEMASTLENEVSLIDQQEKEINDEQKRIDDEISERQSTLKELLKDEAKITPGLDEELLFKFERIIRTKEGLGIVPLRAGVCTGCQMIMPPFFANRVRMHNEIMFCPNCSRIVFYAEEEEFAEDSFDASSAEFDDEDLMFDDVADDGEADAEVEAEGEAAAEGEDGAAGGAAAATATAETEDD